ncbi:MAG: phosphotransferase, partial [Clostridia bacterium]|nr:phosphotransferase [Clostridia bacterium]
DRIESFASRFADILRMIHHVKVKPNGAFPDCKATFKANLDTLGAFFSKYDIKVMKDILDALPSGSSLLHGDWHAQNAMINEQDELKIIDTDDSTFSHPFLDIGSFQMVVYTVDTHPENAMLIHKMDPEEVKKLWTCFLSAYFHTDSKEYLDNIQQACYYFGQLRMAQMLNNNVSLKPFEQKLLVWLVRFNLIFKKKKVIKLFSSLKFPKN